MAEYLKPSDYRELREYIEQKDTVSDLSVERRMPRLAERTDLYLRFTCGPAGIDMWELHDEFDVDVVFCWHDPTEDRLRMGLRLAGHFTENQ